MAEKTFKIKIKDSDGTRTFVPMIKTVGSEDETIVKKFVVKTKE